MRRRDFIKAITASATWPLAAQAQQKSLPVIGFMSSRSPEDSQSVLTGFRKGLSEQGFTEGRNVAFEIRASEDYEQLPALAAELGGPVITGPAGAGRFALAAIGAAFAAAAGLPGWAGLGAWRFASAVTGGTLLAANITSPFLIVGRRRFMPPIPP